MGIPQNNNLEVQKNIPHKVDPQKHEPHLTQYKGMVLESLNEKRSCIIQGIPKWITVVLITK